MLKRLLMAAFVATLLTLASPSDAKAWGVRHVGYTHVGPYGVQHVGATRAYGGYGYGGGYAGGYRYSTAHYGNYYGGRYAYAYR